MSMILCGRYANYGPAVLCIFKLFCCDVHRSKPTSNETVWFLHVLLLPQH